MGDGSKQNEGLHLSVYAFSATDISLLIDALSNRYNLNCTIHQTERGSRIYVDKSSTILLRSIVLEHFVPSMRYKLGL
jgi:hypothetical protein